MSELENWDEWIGSLVTKRSKKPFKGGAYAVFILSMTVNPHSGKQAFKVTDGKIESIVDCFQCRIKPQITEI